MYVLFRPRFRGASRYPVPRKNKNKVAKRSSATGYTESGIFNLGYPLWLCQGIYENDSDIQITLYNTKQVYSFANVLAMFASSPANPHRIFVE